MIEFIHLLLVLLLIFLLFEVFTTKDFSKNLISGFFALFSLTYLRLDLLSAWFLLISLVVLIKSILNSAKYLRDQSKLKKSFFIVLGLFSIVRLLPSFYFTEEKSFEIGSLFSDGKYLVIQGGIIFNHHAVDYNQRDAADIVKLSPMMLSSKESIFGSKNQDFVSFSSKVYSPCSGIVTRIVDEYTNQIPGEVVFNKKSNSIELNCEGILVKLSHVNKGSLNVSLGQLVTKGQFLAEMGNSGMSSEPHLHIQANDLQGNPILLKWNRIPLNRFHLLYY